jgi:hypothetical protein
LTEITAKVASVTVCPPPCEAEGNGSDEEDDPLWKFALKVTAGDAEKVSVSATWCQIFNLKAFEWVLSPLLTVRRRVYSRSLRRSWLSIPRLGPFLRAPPRR